MRKIYSEQQLIEMTIAVEEGKNLPSFCKEKGKEWNCKPSALYATMWHIKNKKGLSKKETVYTVEQVDSIKHAIFREDNLSDIATTYSKKWNKSKDTVLKKIYRVKKAMIIDIPKEVAPSK